MVWVFVWWEMFQDVFFSLVGWFSLGCLMNWFLGWLVVWGVGKECLVRQVFFSNKIVFFLFF